MTKRSVAFWFLIGIAASSIGYIVAKDSSQPSAPHRGDANGGMAPESLARLVEFTDAIVVASYQSVSSLGMITLAPPLPTPTDMLLDYTPSPPNEIGLVSTSLTIDSIIKNDGNLTINQSVTYDSYGSVPTETQLTIDEESSFPIVWPEDTQFILFLKAWPNASGHYYLPYGACGRVLTTVTCSDGDRFVPAFMTGLSKNQFVSAVTDEVNTPSSTATYLPTDTASPAWTATTTPDTP